MAIFGIGIDLIRVDRISKSLSRWGDRFDRRVFTAAEREYCRAGKRQAACFAMRFAAKEAFVKALGLGIRHPVFWSDIEILNDSMGKPLIELSRRAQDYCRELGVSSWHLSLTDDGEYGAAVVIIER